MSTQETELILTVSNRYQQLRRALLIAVMAFTLVGVQLIQSSPLHDHTQHTVDCALCHLQLGDAVPLQATLGVAFLAHSVPYARYLRAFYSSSNPSPYHGRAPPFSSR